MQQALYPEIYLLCRVIHAVDPQAGYLGEVDGLLQVKLAEGLPEAGAAYRAGFVFLEGAVPKEQLCAIGAGVGFMLAMVMFSGVRKRVEACDPPEPFKGLPITLIAAAITSLSFMGFGGIVENLFNVTL